MVSQNHAKREEQSASWVLMVIEARCEMILENLLRPLDDERLLLPSFIGQTILFICEWNTLL